MGLEIERKFLVKKEKWLEADKGKGQILKQGYMQTDPNKTVRIRVADNEAFLTIKGKSTGASRLEYEYTIPKQDAEELLDNFCATVISKIRYKISSGKHIWEIDEFSDDNAGLIVAEIELTKEDETFDLPEWIDREVTDDKRYFNSNLSIIPFKNWK